MKIVTAAAPGTCGEYIQGIVGGEPCLVSSPVDLWSTARAWTTEGPGLRLCGEKTDRALRIFAQDRGLDLSGLRIEVSSEIPKLKGMASSTADICAAVSAAGGCFDIRIGPDELASVCTRVEPSDNLMYPELNLFSHYTGEIFDRFGCSISARVLALDFAENVSTLELGRDAEFRKTEEAFAPCASMLKDGARRGDLDLIGRACTLSARLNQEMQYKPRLELIISLCESFGGAGVMIGHSGSIVGVLHNEGFDETGFLTAFRREVPAGEAPDWMRLHLIAGGVRHSIEEIPETEGYTGGCGNGAAYLCGGRR